MTESFSYEIHLFPALEAISHIAILSLAIGYISEKVLVGQAIEHQKYKKFTRLYVLALPSLLTLSADYLINQSISPIDLAPSALVGLGMLIAHSQNEPASQ